MRLPTLRGEAIDLRPLRRSDAGALYRILGDPQVVRYLPYRVRHETGAKWIARVLAAQRRGEGAAFVLVARDDGEVVGQARLFHWTRLERAAEVGYWIRRRAWGRGYGTEALWLICRFGFDRMSLRRIVANVVAENARSLAALERVGFRREGVARQAAALARGWADECLLGLMRGELRRPRSPAAVSRGPKRPPRATPGRWS